jgi:amidohydrolase
MIRATTEMLGSSAVAATEQSLGGEDFSWMLKQVPGALARLGVRPRGVVTCPDLHHPSFTVDEACIPIGLRVLAELATTRAAVGERQLT